MYSKLCGNSRNPLNLLRRTYHSDGVFGYKPNARKNTIVPQDVLKRRSENANFYRLVEAYRQHAHKTADINPVAFTKNLSIQPELDPQRYGFESNDIVNYEGIIRCGKRDGTVTEAVEFLREAYGRKISAEFVHLESEEEIEWFSQRLEEISHETLSDEDKRRIGAEVLKSQNFDRFLANKFTGVKRYGGEGAESMMAFFSEFFQLSANDGLEQIILAMPHRGRLNLLTGMLNFSPVKMFAKLRGMPDFPDKYQATGDVLSHCISSTDLNVDNKQLHISLLYNPSHLEAVNAVSMGKTRSKHLCTKAGHYSGNGEMGEKFVNIQVHGDAALAGQGINQECLAISGAPHFEIGGSIHLVVNNQLGFTTPAARGRSSRYSSDLAKIISAPVIHVNGDYPEMVAKATRVAFEYQRKFRKDIFIDMNCYRQWGHNELDDPTFTNPSLYQIINKRRTVPDKYMDKLIEESVITKDEVDKQVTDYNAWLNSHLKAVDNYEPEDPSFQKQWTGFSQAQHVVTTWDTGISEDLLQYIGTKSVTYPQHFNIHPHLQKNYVNARLTKVQNGQKIDWATAEAMAFGSLLYQGYNVRISGQDVGRGTFSHRHAMLVDQETNNIYIPLNSLHENQNAFLEVANSILSEEAVLGYEYGMSVDNPNNLIIWEAQFGDFFNGAQIIFDTFLSTGECKWLWSSGLTILLPHGYDGAGPEHSSARIERFLQLTDSKEDKPDGDDVNMQVCQPSTPAQYFHLLRRQMLRNYRKPLIVIAPKTLLRLSAATSSYSEMTEGTSFQPVLGDITTEPHKVNKVIIASGKHYYSLMESKENLKVKDTAIIRLESFCPFPTSELQQELAKYKNANEFIWSQEEPRNMGAWTYLKPRFENLVGKKVKYVGRETLPAPAVGVGKWHQEQASYVITEPFSVDQ
ncbi:PREDICTED: probable 2-oxoglutarate dehydrogenase E1 component DHKTD1 homolog, mitochondrial [Nicrophorus vespilloides]|uniref:Probable 2-oxoglutarate dehydrogenase E1 component DHKTD1 homolog, mitochondrial n=1 Tax=Nicrophorus vespilloides TaxID=110193 RepID=A0ABM1N4H7_NICVS|nr:PREDICTED: probable 2-oxoglutarate dehydrogenase E1 component DHKTD1 homolog, mitochondrial [Nicrophorus vespilloides]